MQHCWQHDVNHPCCESAFPISAFSYTEIHTQKKNPVVHWNY